MYFIQRGTVENKAAIEKTGRKYFQIISNRTVSVHKCMLTMEDRVSLLDQIHRHCMGLTSF